MTHPKTSADAVPPAVSETSEPDAGGDIAIAVNAVTPRAIDPVAGVDPTRILIVEHDIDCLDALQTLLADMPGVGEVHAATTAVDAFNLIGSSPDAEVTAFSVPAANLPGVIFIDAQLPHPESSMVETLATLRQIAPDATIILLCLYPHSLRGRLHSIADRCIRKDTSYRELRALVDELLGASRLRLEATA